MRSDCLARWGSLFLCALFFLSSHTCAAADKGNPATPANTLKSRMDQCTASHGYDPDDSKSLEERGLGKGEEEWRSCVYEGIRSLIAPASAVPKMYEELIEQDRKLTDAIKKGEMTRSERRQKNMALIEEIKREEEARRAEELKKKQKEMDAVMKKKMELDMRSGFQRQTQDSLMRAMGR